MLNLFVFRRSIRILRRPKICTIEAIHAANHPPVDKAQVRRNVESLFEYEEDTSFGVDSKFSLSILTPLPEVLDYPEEVSIASICKFIECNSKYENLKIYTRGASEGSGEKAVSAHIVLDLPSSTSRRALLQALMKAFKPLIPNRSIPVDGRDKVADWVILDLNSIFVHIFDPTTRQTVNLDERFRSEFSAPISESLSEFVAAFSESLPYSIASRPNFIEKFMNRKKLIK